MRILVVGATGYVGGRLVPRLLEAGYDVRVLVRDRERVLGRPWGGEVEVVEGDLLDGGSVEEACAGVDAAFYLAHAMGYAADFDRVERRCAENFAAAGESVRHIVFLGGLVPEGGKISRHLASRAAVGEILRGAGRTTEFRAGPIIGSGSASFEMVRYLTDRLPAMVAPRWICNEVSPVAIRDALAYLLAALGREPMGIVEIAGETLTFKAMMEGYAEVRGYRRWILPLPVLAPKLAALWIGLITPIPNRLAVPLVEGVVQPLRADTSRVRKLFPEIRPIGYREAVERALLKIRERDVETRWSGAVGRRAEQMIDWEGTIREVRTVAVGCSAEALFRAYTALGGETGWLVWDWAWRLRGAVDRLVGGPGLRRGRRDPSRVFVGEAVDFWRVERVEEGRLLRLRAEMKVPGQAWLQFESLPTPTGSRLVQTAIFLPEGFWGAVYWYALYPLHRVIFGDLVRAVARRAGG